MTDRVVRALLAVVVRLVVGHWPDAPMPRV